MSAATVAYGSITIVDLNDTSEFSVQPMSNLPLSVIYDPETNSFTPNWGSSNLQVAPSVYYGGSSIPLTTTGLTITWERQVGISAKAPLTTGESNVNGVLTVTRTQFTSTGTLLTYIVTATYLEPTSGKTLVSQGQITYSLVKNAYAAKSCSITGDSVFKYDTSQALVGSSSIVLTGNVTGVPISSWQYKNSSGIWTTYPNSSATTSLTVNATDNTFVNDKCIIKLLTDDAGIFDLHTITKLRDGAVGSSVISAVLTNDTQMIPVSSTGTEDYSSATSRIIIYEGGTEVTDQYTITQTYTNVTATASTTVKANDTVSVTSMSGFSGNVRFECSRIGYDKITKTFSLIKVESGVDGVSPTVYSLEVSTYAINKSINGALTPSSITFYAYQQTGNNTKTAYSGRMKIFENISLTEYNAASPKPSAIYTSPSDISSYTYTPSATATSILCILYKSGGTTVMYDSQSVVITSDGATGPQGNNGNNAVNVILGNYADILSCNTNNRLLARQVVTIPFAAYEGTTRVPCRVSSVTLLGVTPSITASTASADGSIVWSLPSGTSVGAESGTVSLTFTVTASSGSTTHSEVYSWSRNTAPQDGANSVLLQIFTPSGGNVVSDTITSVTLQATLLDGSIDVTSTPTIVWSWAKFVSNSYNTISGQTSNTIVVDGSTVDSYASYRCSAIYNGTTYTAYYSVFDKTDPMQLFVISSIGTQIVNGQGAGGLYAKVTKNGIEIDSIKSERFLTSNPTVASTGDYYYKIDTTNKAVHLMKFTTSWVQVTETYVGTYRWTWRDKNGNIVTSVNGNPLPSTGKVVYIDGDYVAEKIVADCEVTI